MIVYKDVIEQLKQAGISSARIRREKLLSESTLTRLRKNGTITTEAIDTICTLLHCQPSDIIEVKYE